MGGRDNRHSSLAWGSSGELRLVYFPVHVPPWTDMYRVQKLEGGRSYS